jgi:hypothetical protein
VKSKQKVEYNGGFDKRYDVLSTPLLSVATAAHHTCSTSSCPACKACIAGMRTQKLQYYHVDASDAAASSLHAASAQEFELRCIHQDARVLQALCMLQCLL